MSSTKQRLREKKWRRENPDKIRNIRRRYYIKHKKEINSKSILYREMVRLSRPKQHKKYLLAQRKRSRIYTIQNKELIKKRSRINRQRLRVEVLMHYSYGKLRCRCCGEKKMEFLCLDHIKNDGYKHRKEIGGSAMRAYVWAKRNGYPKIFQTLCYNCNMAKQNYGGRCPHKKLCRTLSNS